MTASKGLICLAEARQPVDSLTKPESSSISVWTCGRAFLRRTSKIRHRRRGRNPIRQIAFGGCLHFLCSPSMNAKGLLQTSQLTSGWRINFAKAQCLSLDVRLMSEAPREERRLRSTSAFCVHLSASQSLNHPFEFRDCVVSGFRCDCNRNMHWPTQPKRCGFPLTNDIRQSRTNRMQTTLYGALCHIFVLGSRV